MKKHILFLIAIAFIGINANAQTNLYENPEFVEISKDHKVIAIVPFKTQVTLRPKQRKKMSDAEFEKLERTEGEGLQGAMFSWFLKRKKRGKLLDLDLQEPKRTNALLAKEGIDYNNIYEYTSDELAKILGVDAIISGDYETNKPMSEGASLALGLLVGFGGATNTAVVNMSVNNGTDGVLLWNYNKKVRGGLGSTPDDLVNVLMRKASRRLAYTKND
jgi:hypothetical protein